jgi:hypothetical protein
MTKCLASALGPLGKAQSRSQECQVIPKSERFRSTNPVITTVEIMPAIRNGAQAHYSSPSCHSIQPRSRDFSSLLLPSYGSARQPSFLLRASVRRHRRAVLSGAMNARSAVIALTGYQSNGHFLYSRLRRRWRIDFLACLGGHQSDEGLLNTWMQAYSAAERAGFSQRTPLRVKKKMGFLLDCCAIRLHVRRSIRVGCLVSAPRMHHGRRC